MRNRPPWPFLLLIPLGLLIIVVFSQFRSGYLRRAMLETLCAQGQHVVGERAMATSEARPLLWPRRLVAADGGIINASGDAHATAIATLEALTALAGLDPLRVTCPANQGVPLPPPADPATAGRSAWVAAALADRAATPGLALDWEAVRGAPASQVILADRDAASHRGGVVVLYADLHTGTLGPSREPLATEHTRNRDGSAKTAAHRTVNGDEIYAPGDTWVR